MPRYSLILLGAVLLSLLAGCSGLNTMHLVQDRPEDLELLLEENEFARARQLTGRYPTIDTPEAQQRIARLESDYVNTTYAEARMLELDQDLLGAVQLLSGALQRVPHNTLLRELRNSLEQERVRQLRINERKQLVTRAEYMVDQQQLFEQQINLQHPSMIQRWENTRNEKAAVDLSRQLIEHGEYALQQGDLENAQTCLDLSRALHATPEAESLLAEVAAARQSQNKLARQQESVRQVRKKQRVQQKQQQKTEVLLAETQQALNNNELQVARSAFIKIPPSASENSEVQALQHDLDQAVAAEVARLMAEGDTEYRADKVNEAIRIWTGAYNLDPENTPLKERLDRAYKVLGRLEELKSRQPR